MTLQEGRDIAVIILVVEWLVLGLVHLALVILAVRGMQRLLPLARRWICVANRWTCLAGLAVNTLMRWLLAPILCLSGLRAGMQAGAAALRRRQESGEQRSNA